MDKSLYDLQLRDGDKLQAVPKPVILISDDLDLVTRKVLKDLEEQYE